MYTLIIYTGKAAEINTGEFFYTRDEATDAADRLHEALSDRGWDQLVAVSEAFPAVVDRLDYDDLADEFVEILEAMD